MRETGLIRTLRSTLELTRSDWVVWAVDARGVFLVHDGPGVRLSGLTPGESVGRSVWEVHPEPQVHAYVRRVMEEACSQELVFNGHRFHVSGGPVREGAMGIALALAAVDEAEPEEGPREVVELLLPVEEVGATAGDLLVWDGERPERVGLYRSLRLDALPGPVAEMLRALTGSSAGADSSPEPTSRDGSAPPPPAPGAHLRLLP